MNITKEIFDQLPISELPDNYDNVDEITAEIIKEFNEAADKIDAEYESKSYSINKIVAERK